MTRARIVIAARLAAAALLAGACSEEGVVEQGIPSKEAAAFVVNSRGETLSRILLDDGTVVRDALALGSAPNAIALAPGGERGYVASSLSNQIDVVDLDQLQVEGTIDVGPGSNPYALVLTGDQTAYVSSFLANEVVRLDLAALSVVRRLPVGPGPEGLLRVENDLYVAVTHYNFASGRYDPGEVVVVGLAAERDSVRARLDVGLNPQAMARAPDGKVHVICTGDYGAHKGWVFVIEPTIPAVVDSIDVGGSPGAILVLEDGRGVAGGYYGGLRIYDLKDRSVHTARALGTEDGLAALAYDPVDDWLYVADFDDSAVHVVDLAADSVVVRYGVGHGPVQLAIRR
jgi:DNA-binding beta-propeller fold protein YncE